MFNETGYLSLNVSLRIMPSLAIVKSNNHLQSDEDNFDRENFPN